MLYALTDTYFITKCDFEIYESTVILTRNENDVKRLWHKPKKKQDLKAPSKVSKQAHKSFEESKRKGKCTRRRHYQR